MFNFSEQFVFEIYFVPLNVRVTMEMRTVARVGLRVKCFLLFPDFKCLDRF